MRKITTHLWYDKEAVEAAKFYVEVFGGNSKIVDTSNLSDTPSGNVDAVSFEIFGHPFTAISAGPIFKFNPSISFHVKCETADEVDRIWERLVEGGSVLMELSKYPFSERYGWCTDKYGLSWQVILVPADQIKQRITPVLMFVGDVCGKAEEAMNFYVDIFKPKDKTAEVDFMTKYAEGEDPNKSGSLKYGSFTIADTEFGAMDSAQEHKFTFGEAISFMIHCETQADIDYFWSKLSAVPESEQCGWLKDKYGVSWQVTPVVLQKMLEDKDKEKVKRVTEAFLKMKKFDIAELEKAYKSNN